MRVFITGINGMLGYDLAKECIQQGHIVAGCGTSEQKRIDLPIIYYQIDLTDKYSIVVKPIKEFDPDVIIHCAAWTNVDAAEDNIDEVIDINAQATATLALIARQLICKIVYISTDYVFDGRGDLPWTPKNMTNPGNVYGASKRAGEDLVRAISNQHFIIRTQWLFGKNGKNFVKTMINLSKTMDWIDVVNDQYGRPTYTVDLAKFICEIIDSNKYGIYHVTNEGRYVSWAEFATTIMEKIHSNSFIFGISTEDYAYHKNLAFRPRNGRLDTSKIIFEELKPLPDWEDALERYLREIQ